MNKEQYEKELSYREGENTVIQIDRTQYNTQVVNVSYSLGTVSRFGIKGSAQGIIYNVQGVNGVNPYDFSTNKIGLIARVKNVARTCRLYQDPSLSDARCESDSQFNDQLEFVSWDDSTKAQITQILDKKKTVALANEAKKIADQKQKDLIAKRCKPYFDRIASIKSQIEKAGPSLQKKFMKSGIIENSTSDSDIDKKSDEFINKELGHLKKAMIDAIALATEKGCDQPQDDE